MAVGVCIWSGCTYPVMQNGNGMHCREHAGKRCGVCKLPASVCCGPCSAVLCHGCSLKHVCPVKAPPAAAEEVEADESVATTDRVQRGYAVYMSNDGGCDYNIACGKLLLWLPEADNADEAIKQAEAIAATYEGSSGPAPSDMYVLKITGVHEVDVDAVHSAIAARRDAAKRACAEKKEREQLAALKRKYEGS